METFFGTSLDPNWECSVNIVITVSSSVRITLKLKIEHLDLIVRFLASKKSNQSDII